MSDETGIIGRCLKGDVEAYGRLVDRYSARILNVALMMVGDRHEAEDIAQDAFIRAFRGLAGFRGRARFSSWLHQIALNLCRDHLKKRARGGGPVPMAEETLEGSRDGDGEASPDPMISAELSETMREEISRLPYLYREAFVLRHLQGMEYFEVAAITKVSADTVRVRAYRARELLRGRLAPAVDTYWREKAQKEHAR
ncbi:MAG TPA: sigma-70 family RNA polymerase sigma factor [Planctomycetota bacterium]|nr:sigma-70 family RNA polymerase sigma factor [Planctomycetota bacterium]